MLLLNQGLMTLSSLLASIFIIEVLLNFFVFTPGDLKKILHCPDTNKMRYILLAILFGALVWIYIIQRV